MNKAIIIFFFTLHLVFSDEDVYEEGSVCTTNDNETGVCRYIEDCENAINLIQRRIKVTNCFFRGAERYVCCVEAVTIKPVVTIKPTITTTQVPKSLHMDVKQLIQTFTAGFFKDGDIECRFNGTFPVKCCHVVDDFTALRFDNSPSCEELEKPSARQPLSPHQSVIYDACYAYSKLGSKCVKDEDDMYKRDTCDRFKNGVKITDGDPAQNTEFPHMAVTGTKTEGMVNITWIGGGSLISEYYILTAAHAVGSRELVVRYALLGTLYKNDIPSGQLYYVVQRLKHPQYNATTKENDIALLKLHTRVKFSEFIRPACLPFPGSKDSEHRTNIVAGWGKVSQRGNTSDNLLKATLYQEYDHEVCKNKMEKKKNVVWRPRTMICARSGLERIGQDSCQGDSGGPLMATSKTFVPCSYFVVGLVSWGEKCGVQGYSSYTNTSYDGYQEWIVNTVWPLEVASRKITLS